MIDQGIKSRPVYEQLRIDRSGMRHLLVVDDSSYPSGLLSTEADDLEVWSVGPRENEGATTTPATEKSRSFRSVQHLLDRLTHRLQHEQMGLRLYAAGQEGFL